MKSRALGVLLIALAAIAVLPESAAACSCGGDRPPCAAVWKADAVFVGTVRSLDAVGHDALGRPYQSTLVTLDVERTFVGRPVAQLQLFTALDGASCGYGFAQRQRYLVYAYATQPGAPLTVSSCSRTRRLSEADEDLRYLEHLPSLNAGARVYGRINHVQREAFDERAIDHGPVEGLAVSVRGAGFYRDTITDADGRYEVTALPAGPAIVAVTTPHGFDQRYLQQHIELDDPRACSLVDFSLTYSAAVAGVVVDANGRPVPGVLVDAVDWELAGHAPPPHQSPARTDEHGRFAFEESSPGSLRLRRASDEGSWTRDHWRADLPAGHDGPERGDGRRSRRGSADRCRGAAASAAMNAPAAKPDPTPCNLPNQNQPDETCRNLPKPDPTC